MERHNFTDTESVCRSMNLELDLESFANSDLNKNYSTKLLVKKIKNVGPKVFNGMLMKKFAERRAPTTTMINKINEPEQV
jgi:hypothetical protein